MSEDEDHETADAVAGSPSGGIGAQLRAAREAKGLLRSDISNETKVSERHLISIENDNLAALPGRTYAVGFVRSYARAVGLDENEAVAAVRAELDMAGADHQGRTVARFEPGDPARVPSAKLAWGVGTLLLALIVAGFFVVRDWFVPAAELPPIEAEASVTPAPAAGMAVTPAPRTSGEVTFIANADRVWVKFYDASGKQLMQKEMALGETYTIPADADGPLLWTGMPEALSITIGGQAVSPLAAEQRTVRDVPVDAASLNARPPGPGLPE